MRDVQRQPGLIPTQIINLYTGLRLFDVPQLEEVLDTQFFLILVAGELAVIKFFIETCYETPQVSLMALLEFDLRSRTANFFITCPHLAVIRTNFRFPRN